MILEHYGVAKSERDLRILLKTTPSFGTIWDEAQREIKRIGFELVWRKQWGIGEIKELVDSSTPVIVGLKREGEVHGHAVVAVELSENVSVADPQVGGIVVLEEDEFMRLWSGRERIAGFLRKIKE